MIRSKHILAAVFLIIGAAMVARADDSSTNLLKNPSFEQLNPAGLPQGWAVGENAEKVSFGAAAPGLGVNSIQLRPEGKTVIFGQEAYIDLVPGKKYTFSAFVKTRDLSKTGRMDIQVINLGWSFHHQTRLPVPVGTNDWKRYSRTFVCPPADQFKYRNKPNTKYKALIRMSGATGTVWVDGLQLEEGTQAGKFVDPGATGDVTADAMLASQRKSIKKKSFARPRFPEIEKPLFKELMTDTPGPRRFLYYAYDDAYPETLRAYCKKFGLRYVLKEKRDFIKSHPLIPTTNAWERGGVGSYPTVRQVSRFAERTTAPKVFGKQPWYTDPRWEETWLKKAAWLAEKSLDNDPANIWGNTWGLWIGDEVFENSATKVVPPEKRDAVIKALDEEVKEQFGFGKFGMPESEDDPNVFSHIAYRRWANSQLTKRFKKLWEQTKRINPKLKILGPNPCGCVPAADIEAMSHYVDYMSSQAWYSPGSFIWQLAVGADTKAMADLSECPVWTMVQNYSADEPEDIREIYSQVFRNGGQSFILLTVEWWDRELDLTQYVNPDKWKAMLEVLDVCSTELNLLKYPEPDTAMLYASDTYLTKRHKKMALHDYPQMYAAYGHLGPCAGTWFSFVSDRQIDRGTRKLGDYKALYIPYAAYQRASVLDKVEQFVRQGGVVVITDPKAFTWNINGESLLPRMEKLTGVRRGAPRKGTRDAATVENPIIPFPKRIAIQFPETGNSIELLDDATKVILQFADGAPAAVARKAGKGIIIYFAADLFNTNSKNDGAVAFVEAVQTLAGAKLKQDIWRFKLPPFKTDFSDPDDGLRCLTMNNLKLDKHKVVMTRNIATNGDYTYSHPPTGFADVANKGRNAFGKGHLTNRKAAYDGRSRGNNRSPAAPEKWIVSWKDSEPTSISFDLKKVYTLAKLKLFYSGILPDVNVETSIDGVAWVPGARQRGHGPTQDVIDIDLPLTGKARYVRLNLGERPMGNVMELAEAEIWGKE